MPIIGLRKDRRKQDEKKQGINGRTMASVSAIYFPRGRERTAMRASLTPTLTIPHVCLMADPRSLPGLLTICGGLTSRYPITVHRRSFLFIVNRDKARCIAFICTAGHVRRSVLSLSGTRSFPRNCRVFIFFFSLPPFPPLSFSLSLFLPLSERQKSCI